MMDNRMTLHSVGTAMFKDGQHLDAVAEISLDLLVSVNRPELALEAAQADMQLRMDEMAGQRGYQPVLATWGPWTLYIEKAN
jgi:hypothetical protein